MNADLDFNPDWYSPPGDSIEEILKAKNISRSEFAEQLGREEMWVVRLLAGDEDITSEVAEKLAVILGGTPAFWRNREKRFRETKARITGRLSDRIAAELPPEAQCDENLSVFFEKFFIACKTDDEPAIQRACYFLGMALCCWLNRSNPA